MHAEIEPHHRCPILKDQHKKQDPDERETFEEVDCVSQCDKLRATWINNKRTYVVEEKGLPTLEHQGKVMRPSQLLLVSVDFLLLPCSTFRHI